MLVAGGVLLAVIAAGLVLGLLLRGVWRRLVALLAELGEVADRLDQARADLSPREDDLERDLALLRQRHPDVDLQVRRRDG